MPQTLAKNKFQNKLSQAIVSTLSFFHIYRLPLSAERIWQLLYKQQATLQEVQVELNTLVQSGNIKTTDGLYGLEVWDQQIYKKNQEEVVARWNRIQKYFWILSAIPFIEHVSIINSVAMGNADEESDIDFFVITKPKRIYSVRTMIILLFKLLGVYKTHNKVNKQFCFGFYITSDNVNIKNLLLDGDDPYMVFWLSTIVPIIGERAYERFIKENKWIYSFVPNFRTNQRLEKIHQLKPSRKLKKLLEVVVYPFAGILEPLLRKVHIRHTFKLPENHWSTSSTIANRQMLKLHALDPRKDLRRKFEEILARQ